MANLDGLDAESLAKLPSLRRLRDAMYSPSFRRYISGVTGSGPLSGSKTDMAINTYTPGCHLLCHDDVIGSRRVSYILYLLDPEEPWQPEWGGALRLYPTETVTNSAGEQVKVPQPDHTVSIPPAFNQLSFFTVQPGASFHDVEEVYAVKDGEPQSARERMAISGWFHIPQEGEEGYEQGREEQMAEQSSLQQLQGSKADEFDLPQSQWHTYPAEAVPSKSTVEVNGKGKGKVVDLAADDDEPELTGEDLKFLLKYMTSSYLTPDTVEELNTMFANESTLQLANFLNPKFAKPLRAYLEQLEAARAADEKWTVARPPHKHRFLFRQAKWSESTSKDTMSPLDELLDVFLTSVSFKKWVGLTMGLDVESASVMARRFRKGMDYTLATDLKQAEPQLELCLGLSPNAGWEQEDIDEQSEGSASHANGNGENGKASTTNPADFGGYELYMAPDDDEDDEPAENGDSKPSALSNTGAGKRREKADPAIYRSGEEDGDGGVLATMPAGWNTLSVVLREANLLRFTKYVSAAAPGDRIDVRVDFKVDLADGGDDEQDASGS